ncbi:NitT/TauT family transport system permease protein [Leucobacter luti]|uniref:ABC transporter permease n=1 Tax=Leucobacter luti TaxID=340320 RepID=UPI0010512A04|nr:ABC transporter permease [Leucobacter luti]MCW2286961.1 NitT/TauT family transport system permease protein [Leucobacter luti]TCK41188.1 NitT/TauT family transport system permease protein [Leucobacter luti]
MSKQTESTAAVTLRQPGPPKRRGGAAKAPHWLARMPWIAPVLTLVVVILLWEIGVRASGVPRFLLPAPSAVAQSMVENWDLLMRHAGVTLAETLIGFVLSVIVGIVLAVVMVMWPLAGAAIFPILVASQVIPKVAIAPLMVVWIGTGVTTASLIAFVMAFFPVVVNATLGMKSVNSSSIDLLNSMRASRWQMFRYLRFPNAIPHIMTGLQLAVAFAIVGAIVGEFVGSDSGLGYLLIVAQGNLRTELLFADLVVLTAMGLILYYGVEVIGRLFLRNRREHR